MSIAESDGKIVIIGVTGASGAVFAQTALRLIALDSRVNLVHLVVTDAGMRLLDQELGIAPRSTDLPVRILGGVPGSGASKIEVLPNSDVGASIASGSYPADAMCVIP